MADSAPAAAAPAPEAQLIQYVQVSRFLAAEYPTAVQLALHAGWTMAVLFGSESGTSEQVWPFLPSLTVLPPMERRPLELRRLERLLSSLSARPECAGPLPRIDIAGLSALDTPGFHEEIAEVHRSVLTGLSVATAEVELAYELGHQLNATTFYSAWAVNRPGENEATVMVAQLDPGRIEKLQARLSTLAADLPAHVATIVAASLGVWSEYASVALGPAYLVRENPPPAHVVTAMKQKLAPQGELWLTLLTSANPTAGLRISRQVVNRVLRRNGLVLVIPAALLAVALYLIFTFTSGVAAVLTALAAIAGSLGLSARGIGSLVGTLFIRDTDNPVFRRGEENAMVSDITTIPRLGLSARGVRRIRRFGIKPDSGVGGG